MILSQLRSMSRAMIPGAKVQVIPNADLDLILSAGAEDIAAYTVCLKANKKFTITADKYEYKLSTSIGDYITVDKPGLWWYTGSKWKELWPRTLKWLDINRPNWRDLGTGNPLYYSIDSDVITLSPTPNTTLSNGLWLYYGSKSVSMTKNSDYPFSGSDVELSHLSIFDYSIIAFARWRILPMLNKEADADKLYQEYITEREMKNIQLKKRLDIANSAEMGLRSPQVR